MCLFFDQWHLYGKRSILHSASEKYLGLFVVLRTYKNNELRFQWRQGQVQI
jgi:hypothetical protein